MADNVNITLLVLRGVETVDFKARDWSIATTPGLSLVENDRRNFASSSLHTNHTNLVKLSALNKVA